VQAIEAHGDVLRFAATAAVVNSLGLNPARMAPATKERIATLAAADGGLLSTDDDGRPYHLTPTAHTGTPGSGGGPTPPFSTSTGATRGEPAAPERQGWGAALAAISGAHGPSTGSTARQLSEAALAADVTGKAQGMVTQLHHRFPRLYGLLRSRYGEAAPLDHAPIVMYEVQRYLEDQTIVLAHCQAAAKTLGRGVAFSTKLDDANLDGTFHHLVRTHGPAFDKRGVFAVTYGLFPVGDFAVIALRDNYKGGKSAATAALVMALLRVNLAPSGALDLGPAVDNLGTLLAKATRAG